MSCKATIIISSGLIADLDLGATASFCASHFPMQVTKFEDDLKDGIMLIELLELLAAPNKVGRFSKNSSNKVQMIANLGTALRFIADRGIKLVNIGVLNLA